MTQPQRILLASSSPRRREVLVALGLDVDVAHPDVEETPDHGDPAATARENCRRKADWVRKNHPDRIAVVADTIVTVDDEVLGKPTDLADAADMLRRLSGRQHRVLTCAAYLQPGAEPDVVLTSAYVQFRPLTEDEIQRYVDLVHPLDKAGAYDIASHGECLVQHYQGSRTSIMGLCAETTKRWLETAC